MSKLTCLNYDVTVVWRPDSLGIRKGAEATVRLIQWSS